MTGWFIESYKKSFNKKISYKVWFISLWVSLSLNMHKITSKEWYVGLILTATYFVFLWSLYSYDQAKEDKKKEERLRGERR